MKKLNQDKKDLELLKEAYQETMDKIHKFCDTVCEYSSGDVACDYCPLKN